MTRGRHSLAVQLVMAVLAVRAEAVTIACAGDSVTYGKRTVAGPGARDACSFQAPIFSRHGGDSDKGRAPRLAPTLRRRGGQRKRLKAVNCAGIEASTRATRAANAVSVSTRINMAPATVGRRCERV